MNNVYVKDSIYDVNSYTDRELYDILELDNPSDRVLEAKILSMVNKYTRMAGNMSAKSAKKTSRLTGSCAYKFWYKKTYKRGTSLVSQSLVHQPN